MTSTTWMSVPAGALGLGSADLRPIPGVALRTTVAPRVAPQGTGVPAGRLRDLGCAPVIGTASVGSGVVGTALDGTTGTPRDDVFAQHDGTTLGFHPSSRPLS